MTPGYKTTEFWLTLGVTATTLAGTLMGLNQAQQADMVTATQALVAGIAGSISSAAVVWRYIASRQVIKTAEQPK